MLEADDSGILLDQVQIGSGALLGQMPVDRIQPLLIDVVAPRADGNLMLWSEGCRRPCRLERLGKSLNDWYFYANGKRLT